MSPGGARVYITADSSGVLRATKEAEGALAQFGESGKKSLNGLAVAGAAVFGGMLAVGELKSLVSSAETAQTSVALLGQAFANAGIPIKANEAALEAVRKKMESLGFTYVETNQSMANTIRATGNLADATKMQALAADLARTRHIDLATATDMVVRSYEGNTRVLKVLGIAITPVKDAQNALAASHTKASAAAKDHAKELDKLATQSLIMYDIQKKVNGAAAAFANTDAGKIAAFNARITDLKEELGMKLLPIIASVTGAINSLIGWFSKGSGAAKGVGLAISAATAAFVAYKVAVLAAAAVTALLSVNPVMLIITAVAALAAGIAYLYATNKTAHRIITEAWNGIRAGILAVVNWIRTYVVPAVIESLRAIEAFWRQWGDRIIAFVKNYFLTIYNVVSSYLKMLFDGVRFILDLIQGHWSKAWGDLKGIAENGLNAVLSAMRGMGTSWAQAGEALAAALANALIDKLNELIRQINGANFLSGITGNINQIGHISGGGSGGGGGGATSIIGAAGGGAYTPPSTSSGGSSGGSGTGSAGYSPPSSGGGSGGGGGGSSSSGGHGSKPKVTTHSAGATATTAPLLDLAAAEMILRGQVGLPYIYGGGHGGSGGPGRGWDCSGLACWGAAQIKTHTGHRPYSAGIMTSQDAYRVGTRVPSSDYPVVWGFSQFGKGSGPGPDHMGIRIGNTWFVAPHTGANVGESTSNQFQAFAVPPGLYPYVKRGAGANGKSVSGGSGGSVSAPWEPGTAPGDTGSGGSASSGNADVAAVLSGVTARAQAQLITDAHTIAAMEVTALNAEMAIRIADREKAKKAVEVLLSRRAKLVKSLMKTTSKASLAKIKRAIITLDAAIKKAWRTFDAMDWDVRQIAKALAEAGAPSGSVQTSAVSAANADRGVVGGSEDPNMQRFQAEITEGEVSGNTQQVTQAEQDELAYLTGLYDAAVKAGDNQQISAIGQLIMQLRSALGQSGTTPQNLVTMNIYPSGAAAEDPRALMAAASWQFRRAVA